MTRTPKMVVVGATALAALVVALVLTSGGKERSPVPSGVVGNNANCASQLGLRAEQRTFRLCLYKPRLSPAGETSPHGRHHWGVVTSVGA